MKRAVKGLDHVVVMVDGIDAAEAAYRKLGFQVQPRGFHRKLGTANHLMIFDKDYFEILGIVEDTRRALYRILAEDPQSNDRSDA